MQTAWTWAWLVGGPRLPPIGLLFLLTVILPEGDFVFGGVLLNMIPYRCDERYKTLAGPSDSQGIAEPHHSRSTSWKINSCKKHKSREAKLFPGARAPGGSRSGRSASCLESPLLTL